MFGVTQFHKYIYGRDFKIQSDHMPLLGLMSDDKLISPLASARIQRWALTLSNYQYHLRYKQGAQNTNTDGLSRLRVPTPATEVPVPAEVVLSQSVVNDTPINAARISKWTARDPLLSAMANDVRQGWPSNTAEEFAVFHRRRDELSLQQGCICRDLASSFLCLVVNVC